jgi:hypothetical protein
MGGSPVSGGRRGRRCHNTARRPGDQPVAANVQPVAANVQPVGGDPDTRRPDFIRSWHGHGRARLSNCAAIPTSLRAPACGRRGDNRQHCRAR